jgi:hypothetical protein
MHAYKGGRGGPTLDMACGLAPASDELNRLDALTHRTGNKISQAQPHPAG